jgi:hypothetical protein
MTRMAVAFACALALTAGVSRMPAQQPAASAASDRGTLAVMRRDGLMIPFAAFKGSKWSAPWPKNTRGVEVPLTLAAVPQRWWGGEAPESWQLHRPDGSTTRVKATAPQVYRAFCGTHVGVLTDYRATEPLPFPASDPFPKDGLAVAPDLSVEPIESLVRTSPQGPLLLARLRDELNEAEDRTIGLIRQTDGWRHPVAPEQRRALSVSMEALYRAPMDEPGWMLSYIEAVRAYAPRPEDDGCGLETFFSGWVHQNTTEPDKTRSRLVARVTYCDRRGVTYMLPFGRVRVGGQQHWVYQLSGFEQEWYEVTRVAPLKVGFVVEASGGGGESCGF